MTENHLAGRTRPVRAAPANPRSPRSPGATPHPNPRSIIVIGAPGEIPRALGHPAILAGRFAVDTILAVDPDSDDVQDIGTRLLTAFQERGANAMLLAGPIGRDVLRTITDLARSHDCDLLAVMPTDLLADHDPVVVWTGDSPVLRLAPAPRRWDRRVKRALDVVGASLGLVVAAPFIAVVSALICLESRGGPLFQHERVGHRGRRFKCFKLRSMRTDAEEILRNDPDLYEEYRRNHFKLPEGRDPRTTRLGRFLRETSLDELPQLWNVLRGDMSLVGPRPVVEDELAMYDRSVGLLLSVRPGLTGAWAVSGRHDVGYPERCAIELAYVRNWTLAEDIRIVFSTMKLMAQVSWR